MVHLCNDTVRRKTKVHGGKSVLVSFYPTQISPRILAEIEPGPPLQYIKFLNVKMHGAYSENFVFGIYVIEDILYSTSKAHTFCTTLNEAQ